MPDGSDRYRDRAERFPAEFRIGVACKEWTQVEKLITSNASRSGVFIRGQKAPAVGSHLTLSVELPDGSKLDLTGTVVHVVSPKQAHERGGVAGFGVRLAAAHEADLVLLESMAQAEAGGKPKSAPVEPRERTASQEFATPAPSASMPTPEELASAPTHGGPSSIQVMSSGKAIAIARFALPTQKEQELENAPCTSENVVGIDFGTSYSSIAAVRAGEIFVVPDGAGRRIVPSVVSYPESGGVLVGWDARDRLVSDPAHTIHSAKRFLGRKRSEPQVANQIAQLAYPTTAGPNDQVVFELAAGQQLAVPQVAAELMRLLRRNAERALGYAVEDAVLTVPVAFEVPQRNALRRAAALAGFRVVGLVEEPAGAALAYGFGQGRNELVAVYDFGGGTFDFTVIDISNEVFRIMVSVGDAWLGGDDFDLALATDAASVFYLHHKIQLQQRQVEWQRTLIAAEACKRKLSDEEKAVLHAPQISRTSRGPVDLDVPMKRAQLEQLCKPLVDRSIAIAEQALVGLGLGPSDIGGVVLTGGVTRIPMVRAAVQKFFDRDVPYVVNPDEAVAMGAAVQAHLLSKQRPALHA